VIESGRHNEDGLPDAGKYDRDRAGTPGIVRVGPSSLNGASHPATRDAPTARR
jgi:hypothetical protein